jgi:hypothetical protein
MSASSLVALLLLLGAPTLPALWVRLQGRKQRHPTETMDGLQWTVLSTPIDRLWTRHAESLGCAASLLAMSPLALWPLALFLAMRSPDPLWESPAFPVFVVLWPGLSAALAFCLSLPLRTWAATELSASTAGVTLMVAWSGECHVWAWAELDSVRGEGLQLQLVGKTRSVTLQVPQGAESQVLAVAEALEKVRGCAVQSEPRSLEPLQQLLGRVSAS